VAKKTASLYWGSSCHITVNAIDESSTAARQWSMKPCICDSVIIVITAEVYPDPQLPSTSAATTYVTIAKMPSTRQHQKPKCFTCNPRASLKIQVLPLKQRQIFIEKTCISAITLLDSQSSLSVSTASNCPTSQLPISDNNLAISQTVLIK